MLIVFLLFSAVESAEAGFCTAIVLVSCAILTVDQPIMMRRLHKIRVNSDNKR
jgi:hypothetical protein